MIATFPDFDTAPGRAPVVKVVVDEIDETAVEFADPPPQLTLLAAVEAGWLENEALHVGGIIAESDGLLGSMLMDGTNPAMSDAVEPNLPALSAVFESLGSSPADETLSAEAGLAAA